MGNPTNKDFRAKGVTNIWRELRERIRKNRGSCRERTVSSFQAVPPRNAPWLKDSVLPRTLLGDGNRHRFACAVRKVGRVVTPVRIVAHHGKVLWGYGQMEQSLLSSGLVDKGLKDLAQLRVATLVGCPF